MMSNKVTQHIYPHKTVVCFGEILWDRLPHGRFLGGAPFNVAYHLHHLNLRRAHSPWLAAGSFDTYAYIVSAVGQDALGDEILHTVQGFKMPVDCIARSETLPTGIVDASFTPEKDACYRFNDPCAWDDISTASVRACGMPVDCVVYGTLACRHPYNVAQLYTLLDACQGIKILDVNFREPYIDRHTVMMLARKANVIKLNREEIYQLLDVGHHVITLKEALHLLQLRTGVRHICVTLGAHGAIYYDGHRYIKGNTTPITVCDTVGAGDAFLAMFLLALLHTPDDLQTGLDAACECAAYVASQPGATPDYHTRQK